MDMNIEKLVEQITREVIAKLGVPSPASPGDGMVVPRARR